MNLRTIAALLFFSVFTAHTFALSPSEDLLARLQKIERLQGEFSQTLHSEEGELLQESEGTYAFDRNGRYRWDTLSPFSQLLIGNKDSLQLYDEDLEQLTIRAVAAREKQTPMNLLTGDLDDIDQQYTVLRLSPDSFKLSLKSSAASNLQWFVLRFIGPVLAKISLLDGLGQKTEIEFHKSILNPHFNAKLFQFKPPAGTDIIDER